MKKKLKRRIPRPTPAREMVRRFPRDRQPPMDWEAIRNMPRLPGRGGPDLEVADLPPRMAPPRSMPIGRPPRGGPRHNPVGYPQRPQRGGPRQGPDPSMVGEDFVLPEVPVERPAYTGSGFGGGRDLPQRPRWEGQLDPGMLPGETDTAQPWNGMTDTAPRNQPQFDLSEDVMNALMEMLMRRGALGGRAY